MTNKNSNEISYPNIHNGKKNIYISGKFVLPFCHKIPSFLQLLLSNFILFLFSIDSVEQNLEYFSNTVVNIYSYLHILKMSAFKFAL